MGATHAQLVARWTDQGGPDYAAGRLEEHRAAQRGWSKAFYAKSAERVKGWVRRYQVERNPEGFAKHQATKIEKLLTGQEREAGRPRPLLCEICDQPDPKGRKLSFDHCHKNGHFRGWLCAPCNLALGSVRDNPETLIRMAAYLEVDRIKNCAA